MLISLLILGLFQGPVLPTTTPPVGQMQVSSIRIVVPMGNDLMIINCLSTNQKDCINAKSVSNITFVGDDFNKIPIIVNGKARK